MALHKAVSHEKQSKITKNNNKNEGRPNITKFYAITASGGYRIL